MNAVREIIRLTFRPSHEIILEQIRERCLWLSLWLLFRSEHHITWYLSGSTHLQCSKLVLYLLTLFFLILEICRRNGFSVPHCRKFSVCSIDLLLISIHITSTQVDRHLIVATTCYCLTIEITAKTKCINFFQLATLFLLATIVICKDVRLLFLSRLERIEEIIASKVNVKLLCIERFDCSIVLLASESHSTTCRSLHLLQVSYFFAKLHWSLSGGCLRDTHTLHLCLLNWFRLHLLLRVNCCWWNTHIKWICLKTLS